MMYLYTCEHCGVQIDRHAQTRLVTDEFGLHFYHVTPDCYEAHKTKRAREAFANAIALHRDEHLSDDHWFKRHAPHYNDRGGNGG